MVRGKFSMKNIRISLDAYKIEYIRRFGIRKITAQGRLSIHGQSPLSRFLDNHDCLSVYSKRRC